jgi:TolA-binding protein
VDCEKFDRIVLDLLYDELDEITSAAARRHVEHCTRCKDIVNRLRATREVGALPSVDPPEGLELRILAAEHRARRELPTRQRVGRVVSMLAGYAMRPQLAMAALLALVIGSSLLLLRTRPGEQKNVLVTERGVPEGEPETVAVVPRAPALRGSKGKTEEPKEERRADARSSEQDERRADGRGSERSVPAARAEAAREESAPATIVPSGGDRAYEDALGAYRDRKYDEAQRRFAEVAARGGENAASAALYEAQSARARSGCPTAAPLFDEVYRKYGDSQPGREAAWQAASCYRTLGDFERARHDYEALLNTPGYADRAQAALASLGDSEPSEVAAKRPAAAKPATTSGAPSRRSTKSDSPSPPPTTSP